jgi:hypothetical protein
VQCDGLGWTGFYDVIIFGRALFVITWHVKHDLMIEYLIHKELDRGRALENISVWSQCQAWRALITSSRSAEANSSSIKPLRASVRAELARWPIVQGDVTQKACFGHQSRL